jgi:hypothetical protein
MVCNSLGLAVKFPPRVGNSMPRICQDNSELSLLLFLQDSCLFDLSGLSLDCRNLLCMREFGMGVHYIAGPEIRPTRWMTPLSGTQPSSKRKFWGILSHWCSTSTANRMLNFKQGIYKVRANDTLAALSFASQPVRRTGHEVIYRL